MVANVIVERSERDLLLESYALGQQGFPKSSLRRVDLRDKCLSGVDLNGSDLEGANLKYTQLGSANLTDANLQNARMQGAKLYRANLTRANLQGADVMFARLSGANLTNARLRNSDFSGADLRGANLKGADLRNVLFAGTYMRDADLGDQWVIHGPTRSDGYVFFAQQLTGDKEPMIKAGCRYFTVPEAWEHWRPRRPGTRLEAETFAILTHLEQLIEIKGRSGFKEPLV